MDTNVIMENEEVIEATEEIVESSTGNGLKVAAGIGLAVLLGVVAYRYGVKPLLAKIKAGKEKKTTETEIISDKEYDDDEKESDEETE
jgi:hypothetical protein